MQLCRTIYYSIAPCPLNMFRAILLLIIRSFLTVITASCFTHVCRCRPLSCRLLQTPWWHLQWRHADVFRHLDDTFSDVMPTSSDTFKSPSVTSCRRLQTPWWHLQWRHADVFRHLDDTFSDVMPTSSDTFKSPSVTSCRRLQTPLWHLQWRHADVFRHL